MNIRYPSIDVIRALSICLMVVIHSVLFLSSPKDTQPWVHFFANHILGDFGAPLFTFLVGLCLALSMHASGRGNHPRFYRRAIATLVLGFTYGFASRNPCGTFAWDVLPFVGVTILIFTQLYKISNRGMLSLCALVILAAPPLRHLVGYQELWNNGFADIAGIRDVIPNLIFDPTDYLQHVTNLKDIVIRGLVAGFFPLFPWLAFPLAGFVMGRVYLIGGSKQYSHLLLSGTALIVAGFAFAFASRPHGIAAFDHMFLSPLSFLPDTTSMVALQMGFTLLVFCFFHTRLDTCVPKNTLFIQTCSAVGAYSLTVYLVANLTLALSQYLLMTFVGTRIAGEHSPLTPTTAFVFGILLMLGMIRLALSLRGAFQKYSIENLLSKVVDTRSMNHAIEQK